MKLNYKKTLVMKSVCLLTSGVLFFGGCVSASYHKKKVQDDSADRLTVGKVQRQIKIGMPSAAVVEALGSPNVVTTDEERREVWVYDKISTNVAYSQSEGIATLLLLSTDRPSGAQSTTQKTLTVIIKFDNEGKVRDFAYHGSSF